MLDERRKSRTGRRLLLSLYRAALAGADPERAVAHALQDAHVARLLRGARRIGVLAAGKAATAMVRGLSALRAPALVVLPRGYPSLRLPAAEVIFASHPEPDRGSLRAARRAVRFFSLFGRGDVVLCLISGGTSSLLALPRPGMTLSAKKRAVRRLARSGASILKVNRLRKSLSAIKGGKLGRKTEARLITLVLSDVPGDAPALVGSGPTVRGRPGDVTLVVGSNVMGLRAASREASRRGLAPTMRGKRLAAEAREAGARFARVARHLAPGGVLLAGGETTVCLSKRHGRGGRNLEFALGAALALQGTQGLMVLAAGSDGIDGSCHAAGAFVDGKTIARAQRLGLDPWEALRRHDTARFFERLGDLLVTGPTGSNVGDWSFAIRRRSR